MFLRYLIRLPDMRSPKGSSLVWRPLRWLLIWFRWLALRLLLVMIAAVLILSVFNPPTTWTILTERRQVPVVVRNWVDLEMIAPVMRRSVVAAEDANFCVHWGFDMSEIRKVIASGSPHGASTISQQTAKNVFLWQKRSWTRKSLEALFTPLIEAFWTKKRILEVYLNVAEFGPGIFGIGAAAREYYRTTPDKLDYVQAARLAAQLPSPKLRDPTQPSSRSRAIADGAATIARDGRASCL